MSSKVRLDWRLGPQVLPQNGERCAARIRRALSHLGGGALWHEIRIAPAHIIVIALLLLEDSMLLLLGDMR